MEREIHQTVEQSQSGGVSGLNRVCAGVKGEGGECVCVCGGGGVMRRERGWNQWMYKGERV